MLCARTDSIPPVSRNEPMTTCVAPTTCPSRMTVAWLNVATGGHLQALERIEALFARVRVPAKCVQFISQQNGRRFADPVDARFSRGILERDDEDALVSLRRRLGIREPRAQNQAPQNQEREPELELELEPHEFYFCSGGTFTAMMQAASPTPLHVCTRTSPLMPTSANKCESAAE